MGIRSIAASIGVVACSVSVAFGAFSDDFSNEATSALNWVSSGDAVTKKFANSACSIVNSDATYAGMVYHTLSPKQSEFTLSAKITLGQGATSAGILCCLSLDTKVTGYDLSFGADGGVIVTKMGSQTATPVLVSQNSAYLTSGANVLKISRKGGVFNIFCNGHFTATFTDNEFPQGDIGLMVDAKSTVVFDDVVMTDTFEEGAADSCFADNFDDGNLVGWSRFGDTAARVSVTGGVLRVVTSTDQNVYEEASLGLKQFVMKAVVSFRRGTTQGSYGLFIRGAATAASIPLAGFVVNGSRYYGAFLAGKQYSLSPSTSIKGAPFVSSTGDTTYYKDTLQVIKRDGVAEYLFVVNGDTLSRLAGVDFAVTAVGVFCSESLTVEYDDFIAAEGTTGACPVVQPTIAGSRGARSISGGNSFDGRMFDLSGRLVSGRRAGVGAAAMVPGVYLRSGAKRAVFRNLR